MSGTLLSLDYDGKLTPKELKKAVYEDVLQTCLEAESAGDNYSEYGDTLTPSDCARNAADIVCLSTIYPNRDMAEASVNTKEAARYLVMEHPTEQMTVIKERIAREKKKAHDYFVDHNAKNRKSAFIGCSNCGSRINREYIPTNNRCPLCKTTFFSNTDLERLKAYQNNIKSWESKYNKLYEKHATTKWYVRSKY